MRLRFLIGAAGAGKTYQCLDEITAILARQGDLSLEQPLYFLVPEQATFQMERALLKHRSDVSATSGARVVSFKRLAHLTLQQTGPLTRPHLGELGKLLALHVAIEREKSNLRVFKKAAQTDGFLEAIAATYTELRTHNHAIASFERAAALIDGDGESGGAGEVLSQKLRDVALIGRAYEQGFLPHFHDAHVMFDQAVRDVREHSLFAGARLWVDGFAGFTPQEYEMLKSLMGTCTEMTVALCLDPAEVLDIPVEQWQEGPADALFQLTRQTLVRLRDIAYSIGVTDISWEALPANSKQAPRFSESPFLSELEQAFVASDTMATKPADLPEEQLESGGLIIEAPNRKGEVEAAAREIQRLVHEEGYRYREVAIIVRDLERYRTLIQATFTRWGIPFFLDHKPSAHHHPVVTLINAVLEMCRTGPRTESVVRCLKTDLVPLSRSDVDILENEALARGIDGRDWIRAALSEESFLNADHKAALQPIFVFVEQMEALAKQPERSVTGREYLERLTKVLTDLNVGETLAKWSEAALEIGDTLGAKENEQVWEGLRHVLEQLGEVLGDEVLAPEEFATTVNAGLQRIQLGRVPPHIDQVLIGSIERSRQPELSCAILLGLNDGLFPGTPQEDPVFSDEDREHLNAVGVDLGPGSRQRLYHEKYLLYVALTRASRRVVLTYSRSDDNGRPLRPSAIIGWARRRYPQLPFQSMSTRPSEVDWPEHSGAVWGWLARTCRDIEDGRPFSETGFQRILGIYHWARGYRELESPWANPMTSLRYENRSGRISPESVTALYGPVVTMSPSGLEELIGCSFRYFAGYGLKLKERERVDVDAAALGTFVHNTLSRFVRSLQRDHVDWGQLNRDESNERVLAAIRDELENVSKDSLMRRAADRYVVRRLTNTLQDAVWALGEHCRRSRFRPYAVELSFGHESSLPPIRMTSPAGVEVMIRGRIDRLDVAEHENRRWFRIIDYKSSKRTFVWSKVVHGLDLQLAIYMLAAVEGMQTQDYDAAGGLYIPVFDPVLSVEAPTPPDERGWQKELKGAGFVIDDGEGVPRLMDETSQGYSDLVPLFFKKDGTLGTASQTIDSHQLQQLLDFIKSMIGQYVDTLVDGETDIFPYELGKTTPCTYCAFKPVCQFDPALPSNTYRHLASISDEDVWQVMEERARRAVSEGGDDARVS